MSCSLRDVANGGFRVLGAVAVLVCLALLLNLGVDFYFARVSKDWPCTSGTITENTVSQTTHQEWVTNRGSGGYYRTWTSDQWHFQYRYVVDGHEFMGSRVVFGECEPEEYMATKLLYGDVTVFYDPRQPSRSVLLSGVHSSPSPLFAILLAGLGFSLILAYSGVSLLEWCFRLFGLRIARR